MATTDPVDPDMTAADLALDLLDGDERAAAMRRALTDRDFAAQVAWWRQTLAGLVAWWPAVEPPPGLEARVMASTTPHGPSAGRTPDPVRGVAPWWRVATIALAGVAAVLALMLVLPRHAPPPPPARTATAPLIAAIVPAADPAAPAAPLPALYEPDTGMLRLSGADIAPANRSAQLWAIGADGIPHALAVLARTPEARITIASADRARLVPGAVLAISLEPPGGAPGPVPTGPVVATGPLTRL